MALRGARKVFVTRLTDIDVTDKEGIGTLRQDGDAWYKYVKIRNHSATVAGAAGDPVGYYASLAGTPQVCIDLTDANNPPIPAGLLMATVTGTLDTNYYGWIQIKGYGTYSTAATNGADGVPVYLGATDKTMVKAVEADSAGVYKMVCGIIVDNTNKKMLCDFPW